MGLRAGMNKVHTQGVYVNDSLNALYEYRIFHTNSDEPDHILITNLRNGKTEGPIELPGRVDGFEEDAKPILLKYAEKNYPNT